jgi:hypothetical protein
VISQFAQEWLDFDRETLSADVPDNAIHISGDELSAERALEPRDENLLPIGEAGFAHIQF